ncbi:uncharacterized protein LOC129921460 [Episyrphus balteatus]|uniref:uncharacterized protein LOC129921460 n=1 Tax=Episyrphus balteatus TaxID=286459 RepID=UPI0024851BF9|nr:uncharacterized protein LOC129921460 [Episyrphus balteatus]
MSKSLIIFSLLSLYCLSIAPATQGLQCYTCRGINCYRTTIQYKFETCQDSLDSCVTIFDKFAVVAKGCAMNIPVELRRKCNDENNPECLMCTGALCNTMGRSDFKCYQCDERNADMSKCANGIDKLTPLQCEAPTAPNSYCYTKTYKGATVRGCSLNVKDQKECLADKECTLCLAEDGEGCNSRQMLAAGVSKISSAFALVLLCATITRSIFKF